MSIDRPSRVPAHRESLDRIILEPDFFGETYGRQEASAYERLSS
ncbi:MAG: hypothetical protein V3U29_00460 [Phycisphaeraceae bacterium]